MLELRNVGYETDDNKEILHDVSLTVQERFVAIDRKSTRLNSSHWT